MKFIKIHHENLYNNHSMLWDTTDDSYTVTLYRESYMSFHFIWNLGCEPLESFMNFKRNDHKCKIPLIIRSFKMGNLSPSKSTFLIRKHIADTVTIMDITLYVPKCYYVWSYAFYDTTLSIEYRWSHMKNIFRTQ